MASQYPIKIDTSITLPTVVDSRTPISGAAVNNIRDALIYVESELGIKPSGIYGTVRLRVDALEAAINAIVAEATVFGGDLQSVLPTSQKVIGIQSVPVNATIPADGYVLTYSLADGYWHPAPALIGFSAGTDLSGTPTSQTVIALQNVPVNATTPSDGYVLTYDLADGYWHAAIPPSFTPPTGTGVATTTSGSFDAASSLGTALQVLRTNAGVTDTEWADPVALPLPLADLSTAGAAAANIVTLSGGVWVPAAPVAQTPSLAGDATGTTAAVVNTQARGLKSATTTVSVSAAAAPTSGQVLTATAGTTAMWQTPSLVSASGVCTLEQFGAVGDGVTSDQAAFEAAAAACAAGTYSALQLGAKTYLVTGINTSSTPTQWPMGCAIYGYGGASILKTTTNDRVILVKDTNATNRAKHTRFENFTILGNSVGANQNGIECGYLGSDGSDHIDVRNVTFKNLKGRGLSMAYGLGATPGPSVSDCHAINCGEFGFGAYSQMQFSNCTAQGCAIGFNVAGGNVIWDGGDLSDNVIGFQLAGGGNSAHGIVSNTEINHCTAYGIDVLTGVTNGHSFVGCHVFQSPMRFTSNTGLIQFTGCCIDPSDYTFDATSNTRFVDCYFTMGYTNTDNGLGDVEFVNPRQTIGGIPAFIGTRMQRSFTFASDANATLSAPQSRCEVLDIQAGVITANRTITSALAASKGHKILVRNGTAYTITYLWATGTGVTVLTGKSALVGCDGTNAILLLTEPAATAPGGSDTQVMFNDSSAFGGDAGLTYNKTTNVLSISDALSLGSSTATTGHIRLPNAAGIYARNSGDSTNNLTIQGGDNVIIGDATNNSYVALRSSTSIYSQIGGSDKFVVNSGTTTSASPIIGEASQYGLHGVGVQAMADANQTPASSVYQYNTIATTGALTANKNLTLPAATDAAAYTKIIDNRCTGAFSVVVKDSGAGTTVTVANASIVTVLMDSRGATKVGVAVSTGSPGGSTTQVQFNDASAFGGDAGLTYDKTNNVLSISDALSFGSIPASAGMIRSPAATSWRTRNVANTNDYDILTTTDGGNLTLGGVNVGAAIVKADTGGGVYLRIGATDSMAMNATNVMSAIPIIGGDGSLVNSSQYGVHGMAVKAMSGSTYTLLVAEYKYYTVKVTGTGTNVIQFPAATDAAGYTKYVWNAGSGTLAVQDTNSVAAAATLAANTGAVFQFAASAVKQLTAAFTVA